MHRRNSSKKCSPSHRKSISSVKSVRLEHISPETAERDARIAANEAFARARERSSTDASLWPPSRTESYKKRDAFTVTSKVENPTNNSLHRGQSVHFVEPKASRSAPSPSTSEIQTPTRKSSIAKPPLADVVAQSRPGNTACASGMVLAAKGAAGDYINSIIAGDEYYAPEDAFASEPSSYRRIRKSRSMFTNSKHRIASVTCNGRNARLAVNQASRISAEALTQRSDENMPPRNLKAPKSTGFLRGIRHQPVQLFKRHGSTASIPPKAESTGSEHDRVKLSTSQSTLFRPKHANSDRVFKKSMRESSSSSISMTRNIPEDGSLRNKARKVSQNFKHKIKNLFHLTKGNDEATIPLQQVKAQKSHVQMSNLRDDSIGGGVQLEQLADEGSLSRVASGVPSLHAVPSNQQLRSRQGSVKSLRSERKASDERSRVTSWSNSDTATVNTTCSQRGGEWERQRLSVIKENGMHISSSSAERGAMGHTHQQSNLNSHAHHPVVSPPPITVDNQRIYSALMKRVNRPKGHSPGPQSSSEQKGGHSAISTHIPPRGSSRKGYQNGDNTPFTIRQVRSESGSDAGSMSTAERKVFIRRDVAGVSKHESPVKPHYGQDRERIGLSSFAFDSSSDLAPIASHEDKLFSVPRIEEPPSVRTLSTRKSVFFGSPTCHLFRTQSPYRRALKDSMKSASNDLTQEPKSPEFNPWMQSLSNLPPMRCPSACESEMDQKMQYPESMYSSNDDEQPGHRDINTNISALINADFPGPSNALGDATIFLNFPVYRPYPPQPQPHHRETSSTSSVEWKTWLSANVSKLEESLIKPETHSFNYELPSARSSGHVRENAQINDENEEKESVVGSLQPSGRSDISILTNIDIRDDDSSPSLHRRAFSQARVPESKVNQDGDDRDEALEPLPLMLKNGLRAHASTASLASNHDTPAASADATQKKANDLDDRKRLTHASSPNALTEREKQRRSAKRPTVTARLVKKEVNQSKLKNVKTPLSSNHGLTLNTANQVSKVGGSANSRRKLHVVSNTLIENMNPHTDAGAETDDPYGIQGSGILGPSSSKNRDFDDEKKWSQGMGSSSSNRMVDLFLSSRRRRMASSNEDGNVFI